MNKDVEIRLDGIREIYQNIYENMEVLDFILFNLNPEKFNSKNNKFLIWLWKVTTSQQIISFYLLMHKEEKHSLKKIINLLIQEKVDINYNELNQKLTQLNEEYIDNKFETIRSKSVVHKDINVEQIITEISSVRNFTHLLIEFHRFLLSELDLPLQVFNIEVKLSLWEIFGEINEYKNLLLHLNFENLMGKKTFTMDDLIKLRTL